MRLSAIRARIRNAARARAGLLVETVTEHVIRGILLGSVRSAGAMELFLTCLGTGQVTIERVPVHAPGGTYVVRLGGEARDCREAQGPSLAVCVDAVMRLLPGECVLVDADANALCGACGGREGGCGECHHTGRDADPPTAWRMSDGGRRVH